MASKKHIFEIYLKNLTQNGVSCKNIEVEFEKPDCLNVKCLYDPKTGKIVVTASDECLGDCIWVKVTCLDQNKECKDCPSEERIKICPCIGNTDCEDCEQCIDNLCVSTCDDGKTCDRGRCVDCDGENPCPQNQICVGGTCQCPPNLPYKNDKGVCIDCRDDNDCKPGYICTSDGCVPKDCQGFVLDPITGECVDCVNSGDCDGDNEICVDKKCECGPGFIRDPFTGECVEEPECVTDADCPECHVCINDECVPLDCPGDQICVGDGCVDPGCVGSCNDGLDCPGDDCGCDEQTNQCVDCSENPNALGCDDNGCEGTPCDNANPCPTGCTCIGGECVSCDNFPCDDGSCESYNGCGCNGNECDGTETECDSEFTLEKIEDSCDLEAKLVSEQACPCPRISILGTPSNFNVTSSGTTPGVQTYTEFDYTIDARKGSSDNYNEGLSLPLLGDTSNDDIADNDIPREGGVLVRITTTYRNYTQVSCDEDHNCATLTPSECWVETGQSDIVDEQVVTFNSIDVQTLTGLRIPNIGDIDCSDSVNPRIATRTVFEVIHVDPFKFDNNCEYKPENVLLRKVTTNSNRVIQAFQLRAHGELFSTNNRLPLFTWFRSKDGVDFGKFRKLYIEADATNTYIDTLFGPQRWSPIDKQNLETPEGELWSSYKYRVTNDCGCEGDLSRDSDALFCNLDFDIELTNCNKTLRITEAFIPCDVNQDLSRFGNDLPADAQSQYILEVTLNDGSNFTRIYQDDAARVVGLYFNGESILNFLEEFTSPVSSVKLYHNHDPNGCEKTINVPDPQPIPLSISETTSGNNCVYNISNPFTFNGESFTIQSFESPLPDNTFPSVVQPQIQIVLSPGQSYSSKVFLVGGCESEINISCSELTCELQAAVINYTENLDGTFNVTIQATGYSGTLSVSNTSEQVTIDQSTGIITILNVVSDASSQIRIVDSAVEDCFVDVPFNTPTLADCPSATISVNVEDYCIPQTSGTVTVSIDTSGGSGSYSYSVDGSPVGPYSFIAGENVTFTETGQVSNISVVFSNNGQFAGNCQLQYNDSGVYQPQQITPSSAVLSVDQALACLGDQVTFTITSGVDGNYTINGLTGTIVVSGGSGSITVTPGVGVSTYSIGTTPDCVSSSGSVQVEILEAPIITLGNIECVGTALEEYTVDVNISGTSDIPSASGSFGTYSPFGSAPNWQFLIPVIEDEITISISNGTCTSELEVTLPDCTCPTVQPPSVSTDTQNFVHCASDNTSVAPSAGVTVNAGFNIHWSSDVNYDPNTDTALQVDPGLSSTYTPANDFVGTVYAFSVDDAGCFSVGVPFNWRDYQTFTVQIQDLTCVSSTEVEICAVISGGEPGANYTYLWNINGGNIVGSNTGSCIIADNLGTVEVTVEDEFGCHSVFANRLFGDGQISSECDQCTGTFTLQGGGTSTSVANGATDPTGLVITNYCDESIDVTINGSQSGMFPLTVVNTLSSETQIYTSNGQTRTFDITGLNNFNLEITDDNDCVTIVPVSVERCECICNGSGNCVNTLSVNSGGVEGDNFSAGTFQAGSTFQWFFNPLTVADRFIIRLDGVIIVDTSGVTDGTAALCASNAGCICADIFLGDIPNNDPVPIPVGTATRNPGGLQGTITLPSTGEVVFEVEADLCGINSTAWSYTVICA